MYTFIMDRLLPNQFKLKTLLNRLNLLICVIFVNL